MVLVPTVEVMTESPEVMVDRRVSVEMGTAPPAPPSVPELLEPVTEGSTLEKIVVEPTVLVTTPSLPEITETIGEVAMATPLVTASEPVVYRYVRIKYLCIRTTSTYHFTSRTSGSSRSLDGCGRCNTAALQKVRVSA